MKRDYVVVDATGQTVYVGSRVNDLAVKGAGNGLRRERGLAPFTVYCSEYGHGFGYVGTSDRRGFVDDDIGPDYSVYAT